MGELICSMENYIEQISKRLKWYIFECSYAEYNQQEVDYILAKLCQYQKMHEDLIESSCIAISFTSSQRKMT